MEINLSGNIRNFRKERHLTQEQLAEVMGVTTGAVYKWESGMSVPDISLIVDLADFFDTSVDVLLGYKMKDNHIESTINRIYGMCKDSNPEALTEAEKLLKKYPNMFKVVHACAGVYSFFAVGRGKEKECQRALELYEQARLLVSQNTSPRISEETIMGDMSVIYSLLGEYEKAVDLMKKHNPNGMFSDEIGLFLTLYLNDQKEAVPYLTNGLLIGFEKLTNSIMGFTRVLCSRNDYSTAEALLILALELMRGLYRDDNISFVDKEYSIAYILLTYISLKTEKRSEAEEYVKKAVFHAKRFDSAPNYGVGRFIVEDIPESYVLRDSLGESAKESVETILKFINDPETDSLWKKANF